SDRPPNETTKSNVPTSLPGPGTENPSTLPPSTPPPVAPSSPSTSGLEGNRAGEERDDNGLRLKLVWCPPGTFTMGSPPNEPGRDSGNEAQVSVTHSHGFWLGKTEVTQGQWKSVMQTEPWQGKTDVKEGANHAASYVSHEDATEFCGKLTESERNAGR